jgi:hypothetical protein
MRSTLADSLLGLWWFSWFGIVGAFLDIGTEEYWYEYSHSYGGACFSITLLVLTTVSWIIFFVLDTKARNKVQGDGNKRAVVYLLTVTGTLLAAFTLLGIFFFVSISPRIR